KNMVQPPDMRGGYLSSTLPRFAKGGFVEGTGDRDSVLAMLTPGEFVVPADIATQLGKAAQSGDVFSTSVGTTAASMSVLLAATAQLKRAVDLGLDPAAPKLYSKATAELNEQMVMLNESYKELDPEQMREFLPIFERMGTEVGSLNSGLEDTGTELSGIEKILVDILGMETFQVLHTAIGDVAGAMQDFGSSVGDTFRTLGGDAVESFSTNMNQMNTQLGYSRSRLREFKAAAFAAISELPAGITNATEFAEGLEALVNAGVRGEKTLIAMNKRLIVTAKALGTNVDSLAELQYKMVDLYKLTDGQMGRIFGSIKNYAKLSNVSTEQLIETTKIATESMGAELIRLESIGRVDLATNMIDSMNRVTAAMATNWGPEFSAFGDLIARAIGGDKAAETTMMQQLGMDLDTVKTKMQSGDLVGLVDTLAKTLQGMNPKELNEIKDILSFEGTTTQLGTMALKLDDINATLKKTGEMGGTWETILEGAANTHTVVDELRNSMSQWVAGVAKAHPVIGDLIATLGEMDAQVVYSTFRLLQMSVKGFGWMGSKIGNMTGLFGKATDTLTTTTTAMGTTGKVAGGLGQSIGNLGKGMGGFIKGLFTGLADGLASLQKVTPYALLVMGGIAASIVALGYAVKLAEKPLIAGIGALTELGIMFMNLPIEKMAAVVIALPMLGLALPLFGYGVLLMSQALAASAPGLLIFTGAMALINATSGGGAGMSGMIQGLVTAFAFDPAVLALGIQNVWAMNKFMAGFLSLTALMAGASAGQVASKMFGGIMNIFGGGSEGNRLGKQAEGMVSTVNTITNALIPLAMNSFPMQLATIGTENAKMMLMEVGELASYTTTLASSLERQDVQGALDRVSGVVDTYASIASTLGGFKSATNTVGQWFKSVFGTGDVNLRPELDTKELERQTAHITTAADINRIITVELSPESTDTQVLSAVQESNKLLGAILGNVKVSNDPKGRGG
ncbi:MAG: hypothetical protein DRP42_06955, partial [Tenericutes bacterium]